MNRPCKGSVPGLVALMDGSLRPDAADRLRRHLDGCPGCSEAYRRLVKTRRLCREIGRTETPELPWRQIEAQIQWKVARRQEQERERGRAARGLSVFALAAGAAAVGAFVTVLVMTRLDDGRPPAAPVAAGSRAAAPSPAPAPQEEELAAVATLLQGDVNVVFAGGKLQPLELERPLLQGTQVITGSGRVNLQWGQGSGVLVGPRSVLDLTRLVLSAQELQLSQGRVYAKLAPLGPGQRCSILAGGIRTSVQGTFFSVELGQDVVEVEVYEGGVRVEPEDGRWIGIDVPAEHRVVVKIDGSERPRLRPLTRSAPRASLMHLIPWPGFHRMMAGTGQISVTSRPAGADLRLDSQLIGSTDVSLRSPVGKHLVELWHGGKLLEQRWVEVAPGPGLVAMDIREYLMKSRRVERLPESLYFNVKHRTPQIRACYDRWLKRYPELEGKLVFRFSVGVDGAVTDATLQSDTFPQPQVGQCALNKILRWRFPPRTAVETLVYPFSFRQSR